MPKHQCLIRKYHWKTTEKFTKLSVESAFSFLDIESIRKMRNWQKIVYTTFYRKLDFNQTLTSVKGFLSCLSTHACFIAWSTQLRHSLINIAIFNTAKSLKLTFLISVYSLWLNSKWIFPNRSLKNNSIPWLWKIWQ